MIRQTLSVCALLAAAGVLLHAEEFRLRNETTTQHTLRFAGSDNRSLTIRNVSGSIRVTGTRDSAVQLNVRRIVRADTRDDLRRAEAESRLTTADQRADVEAIVRQGDGSTCGDRRRGNGWSERDYSVEHEFEARVPAGTRLVLCTVNGGAIEVTDTAGDFDVDNVNGRVVLTSVRGSGSAATVNGSVEATLLDPPARDGSFTSVNGSVVVTWPANLSADLQLKTLNGGLFTDFDVRTLPAQPVQSARRNGRFVYRSSNAAAVRVGQGGPTITLESVNGDIRVLRAR